MGIVLHGGPHDSSVARAWPTTRAFGGRGPYCWSANRRRAHASLSSPDSDLEAFSHNPAHGSFAPLAFQPSAMTNCANQRCAAPAKLPPDNVFRPDRPAEAGLGSKKRGIAPLPIHGIIGFPLSVPVLSWLFDARGRPPKEPFPVRPPAGTRRPALAAEAARAVRRPADGFGTGTPVPSPQSQSFSRGYGSILPTSLAYIVPSTRGCSPWRPDAVMSTTGRGRHSVLRIFKGRRGRTGHRATCGALPAAGPYLRLSRFQGGQAVKQKRLTLPEAPADVSGLPNVAIRTDGRSAPGSRPRFCSDRRALLLIGAWHLPRRPGVGRALKRIHFRG
ncbi:hypothetical protein L1887_56551 [Cichorium endivia]|nr:hypothetical protein L1887_56551 [Cichorium endivia]